MFASVLSASGATIDGLHLSESGHERMAEMIWNVVGRGFEPG
jgi:lysophospholipase L1-like esterase